MDSFTYKTTCKLKEDKLSKDDVLLTNSNVSSHDDQAPIHNWKYFPRLSASGLSNALVLVRLFVGVRR